MKFLYKHGGCDSDRISSWSFRPTDFYEYSWICLREGQGVEFLWSATTVTVQGTNGSPGSRVVLQGSRK
ncbi:hypothetical protein BJX70DRAFT_367541 [Aspergillus crustosus]